MNTISSINKGYLMYDSLLCLQSCHVIADMESRDNSFTELCSTSKTPASQCKFIMYCCLRRTCFFLM